MIYIMLCTMVVIALNFGIGCMKIVKNRRYDAKFCFVYNGQNADDVRLYHADNNRYSEAAVSNYRYEAPDKEVTVSLPYDIRKDSLPLDIGTMLGEILV